MRRGRSSDSTSAPLFIKETINRLRQAGAAGEIVLRADSGFYLSDVVTACRTADVRFSITARMIGTALRNRIEAIPEEGWTPIDYFLPGAGSPSSSSRRSRPDPEGSCWPNAARSIRSG